MVALKSPECFREVLSGSSAEWVETAYKLTRYYFCFSKGGVDQCELALAANLMVACVFHREPHSYCLLFLLHRSAAVETFRP
jgi:hypothetical protein